MDLPHPQPRPDKTPNQEWRETKCLSCAHCPRWASAHHPPGTWARGPLILQPWEMRSQRRRAHAGPGGQLAHLTPVAWPEHLVAGWGTRAERSGREVGAGPEAKAIAQDVASQIRDKRGVRRRWELLRVPGLRPGWPVTRGACDTWSHISSPWPMQKCHLGRPAVTAGPLRVTAAGILASRAPWSLLWTRPFLGLPAHPPGRGPARAQPHTMPWAGAPPRPLPDPSP
ncbi:Hypothetical predicted protein [Marmota monax]|uniref:Uncharacterized protein n=1 Tax=Marmota monax TaxID=9995 RepID=A0A5E4AB98_MARMO|nr:Hypothetical predicted protein [Marmota monax]